VTQILIDYLVTFGWAIVGSLSMAVGLLLCLKLFTWGTHEIDEWEEIKKGNIAVAIIVAAVVLSCAWVVSSVIRP
jgi:uncharacterized membrane protein YjfL (UPF0719 family)